MQEKLNVVQKEMDKLLLQASENERTNPNGKYNKKHIFEERNSQIQLYICIYIVDIERDLID